MFCCFCGMSSFCPTVYSVIYLQHLVTALDCVYLTYHSPVYRLVTRHRQNSNLVSVTRCMPKLSERENCSAQAGLLHPCCKVIRRSLVLYQNLALSACRQFMKCLNIQQQLQPHSALRLRSLTFSLHVVLMKDRRLTNSPVMSQGM